MLVLEKDLGYRIYNIPSCAGLGESEITQKDLKPAFYCKSDDNRLKEKLSSNYYKYDTATTCRGII